MTRRIDARAAVPYLVAGLLMSACQRDDTPSAMRPIRVEQLVIRLADSSEPDPTEIANPVAGGVDGKRFYVLDQGSAEVKVFDVLKGDLIGLFGGPGDEAGRFRRPVGLAIAPTGGPVVLDPLRSVLSFWDTSGKLLKEIDVPSGFYTGLVATEHSMLLIGDLHRPTDEQRSRVVHAIDAKGRVSESFVEWREPTNQWKQRVAAKFAALGPRVIAVGSLNSRAVRVVNRRDQSQRDINVPFMWHAEPDWPRNPLPLLVKRGVSSADVGAWVRRQRLMNAVFQLPGEKLLARFMAFDAAASRYFYYSILDSAGTVLATTHATRIQVLASRSDTLFWVERDAQSRYTTGIGVLRLPEAAPPMPEMVSQVRLTGFARDGSRSP